LTDKRGFQDEDLSIYEKERSFLLLKHHLKNYITNVSGAVRCDHSLKGKPGENPARSRHCNGEQLINYHYFIMEWEGIRSNEPKSGDLPVICACTYGCIGRSDEYVLRKPECLNSS